MPKFDPLFLAPIEAPAQTREFSDPAQPDYRVTLTLRRMAFADKANCQSLAEALIAKWVTPSDGRMPPPWPPPPQRAIRWSTPLCWVLAEIEAMQCPDDPEEAWDAEELVLISDRMPTAWTEIQTFVAEVQQEGDAPGNGSAARGETSSAPPALKDVLTPPSTSTSPLSFGP